MSPFITEALIVGAKEAAKLAAVWFVISAFLIEKGRGGLRSPFIWGVCVSLLAAVSVLFAPESLLALAGDIDLFPKLVGYSFFVVFMSSFAALYMDADDPATRRGMPAVARALLVVLLAVLYFLPDFAGVCAFLRGLAAVNESPSATYSSAALGFGGLATLLLAVTLRVRWNPAGFFDTPRLLLFLAMVKLLGGGVMGAAELSLVPSVQRGVMKFFHDFIHHVFTQLLVPDHPILKLSTWNFIGFFFGPNFSSAVALAILLAPPLIFLNRSFWGSEPALRAAAGLSGAERRLIRAASRADRLRKAVPLVLYVAFIMAIWSSGRGESISRLYDPAPRPVIEDKGLVIIPLSDPTMDLFDGRLHKFSILRNGVPVRFMVMKTPGGALSACLDACEICPPDGYGQSEGNVVCIYCMTPIPVETLGAPGGCNPIPLEAEVSGKDLRIDVRELDRKWRIVTTDRPGVSK